MKQKIQKLSLSTSGRLLKAGTFPKIVKKEQAIFQVQFWGWAFIGIFMVCIRTIGNIFPNELLSIWGRFSISLLRLSQTYFKFYSLRITVKILKIRTPEKLL